MYIYNFLINKKLKMQEVNKILYIIKKMKCDVKNKKKIEVTTRLLKEKEKQDNNKYNCKIIKYE